MWLGSAQGAGAVEAVIVGWVVHVVTFLSGLGVAAGGEADVAGGGCSPGCRPYDSDELEFQHRLGRVNFSLSRKNTGNQVL